LVSNAWISGGRAVESNVDQIFRENQKIGVPRLHGNMLPGNSFPQICVVSVHDIVEIPRIAQEYLGAMT
jgi:hypothetical protein